MSDPARTDRVISRWAYMPGQRRQRVIDALRRTAADALNEGNSAAHAAAHDLLTAADLLEVGARVMRSGKRLLLREPAP